MATEAPRRRRTYSVSRLIQDRQRGHNLRSTTTTLCQPFTTTTFANRALRYSAPPVWNTLPQTVLNSDSVAIFKSRLKIFLFSHGFLSFLCSLTRLLAPAPLKLRPYGAIQICLLLLFFNPGTQFPGNEKNTLCNTEKNYYYYFLTPVLNSQGIIIICPGFVVSR